MDPSSGTLPNTVSAPILDAAENTADTSRPPCPLCNVKTVFMG